METRNRLLAPGGNPKLINGLVLFKIIILVLYKIKNMVWAVYSQDGNELQLDFKVYRLCLGKLVNPIQTGGLWESARTLKLCRFKTVDAMTTKFGDFS